MGWLNDLTGWIDPIKDKIDPLDSYMQTSILGNQDVQNKVLPTIGTTAIDYFYPGAGAMLRASNDASDGNWTGAGINAIAGMYGLTSTPGGLLSNGTDAAAAGSSALSGTEALPALSGTGAASSAGSGSSSAFGPMAGANEFGYQGLSSASSSPMNTQFMTGSAGELAGVGGSGQSLAATTANAMSMPAASKAMSSSDMLNLANKGFKMYSNAQNEKQKQSQAQRGMPMISSPDIGGGQRQFQSLKNFSPYQNFQPFNSRPYGANFRRGLLEG